MKSNIDRLLTVALVFAAVAVAGVQVNASLRGSALKALPDAGGAPVYVRTWEEVLPIANHVGGNTGATIRVVVFSDYECPVCKTFHFVTEQFLAESEHDVEVLHVHFPLGLHRFAKPAARGAECAQDEGRLAEWVNVIYLKQDSLGLKSWTSYATDAGMLDPATIEKCATNSIDPPSVTGGLAFGRKIGIQGTPSVLINGWLYRGAISRERLDAAVDALLQGKEPV